MDGTGEIDTANAEVIDTLDDTPRDFAAEAKQHGWTEKEAFKGDPGKWVDAETFVKRADEVMPFLKKQNAALKREMDELKRTVKQASAHFSKAEERAYTRAMADLQAKHDEAVETGDVAAARAAVKEIGDLTAEAAAKPKVEPDEPAFDPAEARRELNAWVEENDWYVLDEGKRRYADMQAEMMGPAKDWPDGNKAWLAELGKRVDRKFADKKPNVTNGGGNRAAPGAGSKSFSDLPAAAKATADRFYRSGVFGDPNKVTLAQAREQYVKSYDFS